MSTSVDRVRATVDVVVTCVDRKRSLPAADLFLRNHHGTSIGKRAASWLRALSRAERDRPDRAVPIEQLYLGQHWSVARRIPSANSRCEVALWVASAGYGLVPASASLQPYAATFTRGHPDSVAVGGWSPREWWRRLCEWEGPTPGQPRTLAQLVEKAQGAVVVALSPPYLAALSDDLIASMRHGAGRVTVVTSNARFDRALEGAVVPVDGRLRNVLGGSMMSLNVRFVDELLAGLPPDRLTPDDIRAELAARVATAPPLARYNRARLTDREVVDFIGRKLAERPRVSCSALHRQLRDSGLACEQQRFRRLYEGFTETGT